MAASHTLIVWSELPVTRRAPSGLNVTLFTQPKPVSELKGLVWGVPDPDAGDPHEGYVRKWYESPKLLGFTALGIVLVLSIIFL